MSFFKRLFGKKDEPQRQINHPSQLMVGDIIEITDSFALPDNLRKKQFRISAINSYEYEHHIETEWVLVGEDETEIFLSLEIDDKTELKFSLKISPVDVETLFDLEQFATVFDEPGKAELTRQQDTALTTGWTSEYYYQSLFAKVGYFHRNKDSRSEKLSPYEGEDQGEPFELYTLYDHEQVRGIDIEVWEDGDTDVCLTLYRPLTDIVDMYPGS